MSAVLKRILRLSAVLVLLLLAGPVSAQVFYTVSGEQGQVNWLLGTLHSSDERVLEWSPVLEQAVSQADTVMLELYPDADALRRIDAAMLLPAGQSLDFLLPSALFDSVTSLLRSQGLEQQRARRLRPWAALMVLSQPEAGPRGFMDMNLATMAQRAGAAVSSLETVEEQLDVLSMLPIESQRVLLRQAVLEWPNRHNEHDRLVQHYLKGDLTGLRAMALESLSQLPDSERDAFFKHGLVQRNRRMSQRVQSCLEIGRCLIAVGALHLPGDDGLIELLNELGWRVEPVY